ncbi:unnamed protein product [Cuscuta epithymum]|uniref:Uncharacterized protein n=1 Tax=Cuscuta epithymum TaxID=186058 RepID=A0AAV0F0H7_9ASTE|nr:unnamed protein product [Cuscuta epithymum]
MGMGEPNREARYDGAEGPIALHKTVVAILEGMDEPNRESGHDGAEGPIVMHKTFVATLEGMGEPNRESGHDGAEGPIVIQKSSDDHLMALGLSVSGNRLTTLGRAGDVSSLSPDWL